MSAGLDYFRGMARPEQSRPTYRTFPERCAGVGHPGVTFNPWRDRTWCLCGEVIRDGNTVEWPKADRSAGPLAEWIQR